MLESRAFLRLLLSFWRWLPLAGLCVGKASVQDKVMRIVGLTGGIASGKSTASNEFNCLGVPVIDADKVAHETLKKGTLAWRRVVRAFGKEILQEDGEIDRSRLGAIIFVDPAKRSLLNNAMSFSIGMGLYWELFKHFMKGTKVVMMDVPLLFETKLDRLTKPVIVVWIDSKTQAERLMQRDNISEEQASQKISSQLPLDAKRNRADVIIDNSGTLEVTKGQVQTIYNKIMGPLTWKEALFSRSGLVSVVISAIAFWCAVA